MAQILRQSSANFENEFRKFLDSKREVSQSVDDTVRDIIKTVREQGDQALIDLSAKFDRVDLKEKGLQISDNEID